MRANKKLIPIIFVIFSFMSCGEVQEYYISDINLYIELKDNLLSKQGCIYLRQNKRIDNFRAEYIVVERNTSTRLLINLKEKNKIYIGWNSYNVRHFKQQELRFINCDKTSDTIFYKNPDSYDPKILKDNFIEISIGESLDGVWIKKASEVSFTKIKEIDR